MQTQSYKGTPVRAWVTVRLLAPGRREQEVELLADTGNPFAIIISAETMAAFKLWDGPSAETNFGTLRGGLLRVAVPQVCEEVIVVAYASDAVFDAANASHPSLGGLAGLPLLRQFRCGGDSEQFWVEPLAR